MTDSLVGSLAVILAAGTGTRLQPVTDTIPKCLIEVAGRPLLEHLLDALAEGGVRRAVIVTGHLADRIDAHLAAAPPALEAITVRNPAYATTNNAVSLGVARAEIANRDFVLCDADVIFSANPIPALLALPHPNALVVDVGAPFDDEAMKVEMTTDGRVIRVSKQVPAEVAAGESIGIQRIGASTIPQLWNELESVIASDRAGAYYEDAFQRLIDRGAFFGICPVAPDSWMEIDDAADLEKARRAFSSR